jgi:hypothetical protein
MPNTPEPTTGSTPATDGPSPPSRRTLLAGRSTTDLLILMIAGTVCFAVLAFGAAVAVIEIRNPDADTSTAASAISDILNTLIGLLAGFLAGRTDALRTLRREQDND